MIKSYKVEESQLNKDNRLSVGIARHWDRGLFIVTVVDGDEKTIPTVATFEDFSYMVDFLKYISPFIIVTEAYGFDSEYWFSAIAETSLPVRRFKITKSTKTRIYTDLIKAVNEGLILNPNRSLLSQLFSIEVNVSKTGNQYLQTQNASDDNYLLSCALAYHGANKKTYFRVDFA